MLGLDEADVNVLCVNFVTKSLASDTVLGWLYNFGVSYICYWSSFSSLSSQINACFCLHCTQAYEIMTFYVFQINFLLICFTQKISYLSEKNLAHSIQSWANCTVYHDGIFCHHMCLIFIKLYFHFALL